MAGGIFDKNTVQVRPGVYVNVSSSKNIAKSQAKQGTVIIPLIDHDYGPTDTLINIPSTSPDIHYDLLGHSVNDIENGNMLMIRESLKNAANVIVWIVKSGTKATGSGGGVTATAKYGGVRGNDMSFVISANVVDTNKFDVIVYWSGSVVSAYYGIASVKELTELNDPYVSFTESSEGSVLEVVASVNLSGATSETATNDDVSSFLDSIENAGFDVLCFPVTDDSMQATLVSKIKYLNDSVGKSIVAVVPNKAADYEFIINVTNSVKVDGVNLSVAQATAWVAGAYAGARYNESLTYREYDGATEIIDVKSNEEAIESINNGEFFFSYNDGSIVVECDINSLVTISNGKDKTYRKNRVIRTISAIVKNIKKEFSPNKYSNDEASWDIMDGQGAAILKYYEDNNAIKSVDYDDFKVDRELSNGDNTYFNVAITPIDSSEKLYFTITTN